MIPPATSLLKMIGPMAVLILMTATSRTEIRRR
jgi:hypothetical protein